MLRTVERYDTRTNKIVGTHSCDTAKIGLGDFVRQLRDKHGPYHIYLIVNEFNKYHVDDSPTIEDLKEKWGPNRKKRVIPTSNNPSGRKGILNWNVLLPKVRQMADTHTIGEIAKNLDIQRATLYSKCQREGIVCVSNQKGGKKRR